MKKGAVRMNIPKVFNIQRFSTHDGDGVRTTIFFKGCPLRCRWCHNPESQRYHGELITYKGKCTACGRCVAACPNGCNTLVDGKVVIDREKCTVCGECADVCCNEAREVIGREYTVNELFKEAMKDAIFFEQSGGGVTLSGGEVMAMDIDYVEALCRKLHREGVSVFIDTCGFAPYEKFERLLPYVDVFMVDIKLMDPQAHREYIGVDNALILENITKLSRDGAGLYIRIPTVGGVNANDRFMNQVAAFLRKNNVTVRQINLLPYHDIGKSKYANLDLSYDEESMTVPSNAEMEHFKALFEKYGFQKIKIGG